MLFIVPSFVDVRMIKLTVVDFTISKHELVKNGVFPEEWEVGRKGIMLKL